jgi:hypothetical protein
MNPKRLPMQYDDKILCADCDNKYASGEVRLSEWELRYATTRKDYRGKILFEGKRLFDALLDRAVEPFETVYAEVVPGNTSKTAERLPLRGFKEEAGSRPSGTMT